LFKLYADRHLAEDYRMTADGRECEATNGSFVEFRFTQDESSRTAAMEKAE